MKTNRKLALAVLAACQSELLVPRQFVRSKGRRHLATSSRKSTQKISVFLRASPKSLAFHSSRRVRMGSTRVAR